MKTILVAGVLFCTAGAALGAYVIELSGGDQMTVESYWEDGEQLHMMRGGVDLIVPKSRLVSVHETSDDALPPPAPASRGERVDTPADTPADSPPAEAGSEPAPAAERPVARSASTDPEAVRQDLGQQKDQIEHDLLRAQAARFEAAARGDDPKEVKKLEAEFKHQQQRRIEVNRELKALDSQ